jgi:hypothetical protein
VNRADIDTWAKCSSAFNKKLKSFEDKNWLEEGFLVPTKEIKKKNC